MVPIENIQCVIYFDFTFNLHNYFTLAEVVVSNHSSIHSSISETNLCLEQWFCKLYWHCCFRHTQRTLHSVLIVLSVSPFCTLHVSWVNKFSHCKYITHQY